MATHFDFYLHRQYNEFNAALFNNMLPRSTASNFKLMFNRGLTRSLGRCKWTSKHGAPVSQRKYAITIAESLYHFNDIAKQKQFMQTLLHEMVHLYMYITDGDQAEAGHGPRWQSKWISIGAAYDAHYGMNFMRAHATAQCSTQYAGCREKTRRTSAAAATRTTTKWTLTCPVCGYVHHSKALNGRIMKLAITTDNVRHGKGGACSHRLVATRNW